MGLVVVAVLRVLSLSGFHRKFCPTVRKGKVVIAIEYFHVIGLFIGSGGFS